MRTNFMNRALRPRNGTLVVVVGLLMALVVPSSLGAVPSTPQFVGSLGIGDSHFWDGEYVPRSRGGFAAAVAYFFAPEASQAAADPCLTGSTYCRLYKLEVTEQGGRLRIALDASKRGECFALEVRDPDGGRASSSRFHPGFPFVCPEEVGGVQAYNLEIAVPNAARGKWQVRALGVEVEDWAFRMRATLEVLPTPGPDLLEPNLVPWLPWEFGFIAPASQNPGSEIDRRNPPGEPGVSCHSQEAPASKCLRFSSGVYNVGDGPLFMVFREDEAFQHVYYADSTPGDYTDNEAEGNYRELPAGPAEFHPAHRHRHFPEVFFELFAVSDDSPGPPPYKQGARLTRFGAGAKHGWCSSSQQFEDWFGFEQDDQYASFGKVEEICDKWLTLERGWGHVPRWQRTGQYVPYDEVADPDGTMRAGLYIVRVTVDPEDRLAETENDNVGYAYIRVIDGDSPDSDRVVICERGFGKSPWDPSKEIVGSDPFLWAKLLQDPSFTPESC